MSLIVFLYLLLGFAVLMYVALDGFDLGLGILYPWFQDEAQRDIMMRSISHVWDGNETWLVFGGVLLLAAFPLAYAQILSSLYLPIMLMLFGLILRGVAFEYRFKAHRSKRYWDLSFFIGSALAAFCQGVILGALVQGGQPSEHGYEFAWTSWFALVVGVSVMAAYALLACGYLLMKTRDKLAQRAAKLAQYLVFAVAAALAWVSLSMLLFNVEVSQRWLNSHYSLWLWPLPLLSVLLIGLLWVDLGRAQRQQLPLSRHARPFVYVLGLFLLAFIGLVVSLFPYIIPFEVTLYEAQSAESAQWFILPGILIFLPLVLGYTLWGYRIFSGKVEDYEQGY